METFNIRDLRNRTSDLVREAEHGKLSLITKHGQPIFIAVPFNEALLQSGVKISLAVGLFVEQKVGLAGAARRRWCFRFGDDGRSLRTANPAG